jgi:hypothetical protein
MLQAFEAFAFIMNCEELHKLFRSDPLEASHDLKSHLENRMDRNTGEQIDIKSKLLKIHCDADTKCFLWHCCLSIIHASIKKKILLFEIDFKLLCIFLDHDRRDCLRGRLEDSDKTIR